MDYVRINWKGPFTLDELQRKRFGYDTRFNFYLLTTLDEYRDLRIKYIGKTTQTILERLENHHKWDEIKDSIKNPLRGRISSLIEEKSRMKLFIESLVDNLENNQSLLGRIIVGLLEKHIFIFVGQATISKRPFRAYVIDRINPVRYIRSNIIPNNFIDPIENALIFSILPEFNDRLIQAYHYPDKKMIIRSIGRPVIIDDINTSKF